jgi:hypothetical protein
MELRIDARKVAAALLFVAIALICLHIGGMFSRYILGHRQLLGMIDTFDVNAENNVPTFFSAFLLLACAGLLAVVARRPNVPSREARYWGWLGAIFLFLALDEDASIHELFIEPIRYTLDLDGLLYFAWVLPYGIAMAAVGLLYLRFVFRMPEPTRYLTIAAGGLYLAGALGFEMIGGWYLSVISGEIDFPYLVIVAGEEFLEMCGSILFLYTLLDFLSEGLRGGPLSIMIRSR